MQTSIWNASSPIPKFPVLDGDIQTDVLIVGGGLTGILTAYTLSRHDIDYLLIESGSVCSGVSGNTTAKLTSQHGLIYGKLMNTHGSEAARLYWEANQRALAEYRQLARQIPCDFETADAYVYAVKHPDRLEKEWDALQQLGIPADFTEQLPLPFQTAGAIRFSEQAQFHPLKFSAGIAQGLNIREHTAVHAFDGNTAVTNRGRIKAAHIVVATHFPLLNKHGAYFLKMYQHRSYVLALKNASNLNGMYVDEAEPGLSFRTYGGHLLLGGGSHRTGKQGGNWAELEAFAKVHYPTALEVCRWATQDCTTLDGIPYIGQYSKRTPALYVATGYNKWGMTSSMVAAELLCDLIRGKESPYAELFSPSRSILHPQLFANALEATKNLLTISSPRCPHLGCALKWNPQEHSWDCPCHGSRFSADGTLLDNPATGNLKRSNP